MARHPSHDPTHRTNLTLPKSLVKRLLKFPDLNWSKIATDALLIAVERREKGNKVLTVEERVKRIELRLGIEE